MSVHLENPSPSLSPSSWITRSYFRTRFQPNRVRNQVWESITRFLEPYWALPKNAAALEIGTGYGSWIRQIRAEKRVALDINPDLPEVFRKEGIRDVETLVGSCVNLAGIPSNSLDLVCASNVLEHLTLDDAIRTAHEIFRVLKPGGAVTLVQPNFALKPREYFDDFTHRTIFTQESLRDLFEASGFESQKLWKRFMPFSMKSSTARLSFLVPLYLRSPIKPLAGQMCLIARKPSG
jgi:ubiquinone/menaquinone biosynthesis C-methylase UbiE